MPNTNGLISSKDVSATGDVDSNFFVRVGDPIAVPSPLQIISSDGTKVVSIIETNGGDTNINLWSDSDIVVNTDPTTGAHQQGITLQRNDVADVAASMKLNDVGDFVAQTSSGQLRLESTTVGEYSAMLSVQPGSGQVAITNLNDTADGRILLQCAEANSSDVVVYSRPPGGDSGGISIINATSAPTATGYVRMNQFGALELSASTTTVNLNDDVVIKPTNEGTLIPPSLTIRNSTMSATPTKFQLYNASQTAEGLTEGHLQLFGYSGPGYGTIAECVEIVADGSAITLGDNDIVGGAVVGVNGPSGVGRVYDSLYNRPFATLIRSFTTPYISAQDTDTFTVPATGKYLVECVFDSEAGTTFPTGTEMVVGFIGYGDPAHSAALVIGSDNRVVSTMIPYDAVSNWNQLAVQRVVTLQKDDFEPNQRYILKSYATSGIIGGSLTINVYQI